MLVESVSIRAANGKALSVIVKTDGSFAALVPIDRIWGSIIRSGALNPLYGSWAQGEW